LKMAIRNVGSSFKPSGIITVYLINALNAFQKSENKC
jgi:hypothetical protein